MSDAPLYTVGHSNRALEELLELLRQAGVQTLVDVRARPYSDRYPHFSGDALRKGVEAASLVYHWAGRQIGARRPPRSDSPHAALTNEALRGYADYMDTDEFKRGVAQLRRLAARAPTAILCAERLPEDCHRSLIADYLTLQGARVLHLIGSGETREHQLRPEARRESGQLIYDRNVTRTLL